MEVQIHSDFLLLVAVRKRLHRSRTAMFEDIRAGLLPPTIIIGGRLRALPADEVEKIAQARAAGCSQEEIRRLVAALVARRTANRLKLLQALNADQEGCGDGT